MIDVHHHFEPAGTSAGWTSAQPLRTPASRLADMDRDGIGIAVGYAGPVRAVEVAAGRAQARQKNEAARRIVQAAPNRFGMFASLPMLDVDGALVEIGYALDTLEADGFGISTNYGATWLGDERFDPIFAELDRRKAVVFVHPVDAPCCTPQTLSYEKPPVIGVWLEWPMNTARTIFSLMVNGTLRRYPNIRFVFSHGGGVMPLLVGRVAGFEGWNQVAPEGPAKLREMFPGGIEAQFGTLYFELAQAYAPEHLQALLKQVPQTHLLFGTDYENFDLSYAARRLDATDLSSELKRAIGYDNALALFPRFRST